MAGMFGSDSQLALDAGGTSTIIQGKLEEPDHSSANWYFCREEIEGNSPSRSDGIDLKKETYFRKSYCTFLQDLGMRLKVPQVTIATAITFCHRFFLRQSHAKNDRLMIATICMFLAGKVEETPRPIRDVIHVSYEIRNKKDPQAVQRIKDKDVLEAQKDLVLYGERLVLTTLGFDLNIHHPYKPLVAAIKRFKVPQNALAQVAWNFVNDGLRTSLCLQFKPHHIAAGAIFLAAKFLKVKLPNDGERAWWQEFGVTPRQLEEVSNQMLELYEQNKAPPTSSDPNAAAETGVQYRNANIHNDTGTYYGVKSIHADSHVPVINHQSPLLDRRNTMLGRKTRNGYSNGVDKNDEDTEDKDDMVCGSRDSLAAGGADESYCSEGLTAKERASNYNHLGGSHVHVKQEANRLRDAESLNNVRFSSKQPSADVSISDNQQNLERPISHSLESNRSRYKSIDNYSDKDELLHSSVGTTTDQIRDTEPSGKKRKKDDISALDRKSVKVKNEKSYGSAGILETMLQQRAEEGELYSHELSHSPKAVDRNLKPVNDEKASSPMKRREVDRDHYGRKDDNKHRYTHNRDHHHHNLQQRSVADREHHYHKDHEWQELHDQKARYDH